MALPFVPVSDPEDMYQPGTDGQVQGMVVYPNSYVVTNTVGTNTVVVTNVEDKSVIVGGFHTFNTTYPRNGIARVNVDGTLDQTFLAPPLDGANGVDAFVSSVAAVANQKILIGGSFEAFNGAAGPGVALLNNDGSLDITDFSPGLGAAFGTGLGLRYRARRPGPAQWPVPHRRRLHRLYGAASSHIARLNANGSLDTSFHSPTITGDTINALAFSNGHIFIGGDFSAVGTTVLNNLACLNSNGSLNLAFANNMGAGVNGIVHALSINALGNLMAGGDFLTAQGFSRPRIARFTSDGSLDTTFDPGIGADNTVFTILPPGRWHYLRRRRLYHL